MFAWQQTGIQLPLKTLSFPARVFLHCDSPAIGKRVLVQFSDDVWYKGTINARVKPSIPARGGTGANGSPDEWHVLFDDTDTLTFFTGDPDGTTSALDLSKI